MNSMSPWHPDAIASLTPLQLLCLASEHTPGRGIVRSEEEYAAVEARRPQWEDRA